jgi:hypothetical protein
MRMRWMGYAACKGKVRNAYFILDRMQRPTFKWVGIRNNGSLLLMWKYLCARVLRRMFKLEMGGVTGDWRKLHNGKFQICNHH